MSRQRDRELAKSLGQVGAMFFGCWGWAANDLAKAAETPKRRRLTWGEHWKLGKAMLEDRVPEELMVARLRKQGLTAKEARELLLKAQCCGVLVAGYRWRRRGIR
jgi:hypothetical protein